MIKILGTQNTPLNSKQQEEARCYLSNIGNFCGCNADKGAGCQRTVEELKIIWKADYLQKKKKIPERKHPFLVVNEKMGNGLHRSVDGKSEYCGNVNYYCKSCNMIFNRRTGDLTPEKTSFESIKSHKVRPQFKNELLEHLGKHHEICKKGCINKWSGREDYNCSQQLLYNALAQEMGTTFSLIDKYEWGIVCNYINCDGQHIILKDNPPMVRTDYQAFLDEQDEDQ